LVKSGGEMCLYRSLLGDAGLHVVGAEAGASLDMHDLQQVLSDKMHLDADAAASFVAGLRLYMDDDPYKVPPPPHHTHTYTQKATLPSRCEWHQGLSIPSSPPFPRLLYNLLKGCTLLRIKKLL